MVRLTFEKLCKHFYDVRKNRVDPSYYEGKFKHIKQYFEHKPITYDTVGGFFRWLEQDFMTRNGHPISNSTKNKYLQLLKVCARLTGTNIDEVKGDNESFDRVETEKLTLAEYEAIMKTNIDYTYGSERKNFFDLLVIEVMVITTQRPGNVSKAKWIDYKDGWLQFRGANTPKNGRPHKTYLPAHIQAKIRQLERRNEYIFATDSRGSFTDNWLTRMIRTRCKLAGITKNITAKSLRGTGITQYLSEYDLQEVVKISGHKDPQVVIDHYYNLENKRIEAIVNNNPFNPAPITNDEIRKELNALMERLNKRKCQALVLERDRDYIFTVSKIS